MPKFHFSLITFKAHIRQKPKYIYRHNELSRYYKTSEKSISNKLFFNGSTLKSTSHSRDTTHNCVVEPSSQMTFVLTCRLYNYTHYISNIPHFPPHNTQLYPEKVTNYHPAT
jgi:hypothetical protein